MTAPPGTRLLVTLEKLLELPAADVPTAMIQASNLIAAAVDADKVDAFLYDPQRDCLVAVGSSQQPLSVSQHRHGLDVLPVGNGGRVVWVYQTGKTYLNGHVDEDLEELRGIRETLAIRSKVGVPLDVDGKRRGMIMVASQKHDHFQPADARFLESVAHWVGVLAHRAELVEAIARSANQQGRRAAAEELITVFAHDMRNQLNPIATRLGLLQRRAAQKDATWAQRDLELSLRSLKRLGALASDILDVARLDHGLLRMDKQVVDLAALAQDVVASSSTHEHPVELRLEMQPCMVAVDPARARQCLENLVFNAIGHAPEGTSVVVTLGPEEQAGRTMARLEVIDQGPGVPPEIASRIFDPYVTGQPGQGLGLGLYLSRTIAELHNGDLSVDIAAGRGGRFILRLPCETNA